MSRALGRTFARTFALVWMGLAGVGACNGAIAQKALGRRLDLRLPHLQQAYVMFIEIPRSPAVHTFVDEQGQRRSVADLQAAPAIGYARARIEANFTLAPELLRHVCRQHIDGGGAPVDITTDEHRLNFHPERPYRSYTERCTAAGLARVR
ncbi:MAG: hypothetical protein FJ137_00030 [Deltaproteobacteria bacterium]|nr:hypothetical protein [Deltaproteobacteria bacterium]